VSEIVLIKNNIKQSFVDVRFARRPTQSGSYEIDSHFFLTHPVQFIYTHYPDDTKWQQLHPQITEEEFCNMPIME
jgi:transglutaminase/protease-like cytokinesis protein 3